MESIVKTKIIEHIEKKMFSIHEHGFRRGHSCVTQLLEVIEMWPKAIDSTNNIDVIYIDFRKAFDSVPFERFLVKLKAYGFCSNVLNWIKSFLNDRRQRVIINGTTSEWADVVSGVPHGSVLGPSLFLLYINDMPDTVQNLVKIFADDTKLFAVANNEDNCDSIHIISVVRYMVAQI